MCAVFFNSLEDIWPGGVRLEVRIWLAFQISVEASAARYSADLSDGLGEGAGSAVLGEAEDLVAFEDKVDGATEARPELDLAGNRALERFSGKAGVENEGVGELNWLAHAFTVAYCYRECMSFLFVCQRGNAGEGLAFEVFEAGAAAGGDMGDLRGVTGFVDG